MLEKLKRSLELSPVVKIGSYNYFVHQISDGVPGIEPSILEETVNFIIKSGDLNVDKIVTIESMGIPIATALSLKTGIPVNLIRKKEYGIPGEIKLSQETGYSKGTLYLNGLKHGDRILIVDDVISTGGTMISLLTTLNKLGVIITGVFCTIGRGDGQQKTEKITGIPIVVLVKINVDKNGVQVIGGAV